MTISIKLLTGHAVDECLDELAALRIEIFREYPYLYKGKFKDELGYLRRYAEAEGACVITVADEGTIVGAATGIPLSQEDGQLIDPVSRTDHSVDEVYYVGELLFYPAYRNRGLGMRLLALMEEHVRSLGNFHFLVCATVVRPDSHPLHPPDYLPIDRFLARTGFGPLFNVTASFTWLETDGHKCDHPMNYWIKEL